MLKNKFKNLKLRFQDIKDEAFFLQGKQLSFAQKLITPGSISEIEFKVFSQWGEDGIIEYLVSRIPLLNKTFIELGVENYNESNTRFLMFNRNWSGIIVDGSDEHMDYVKNRNYYWKYDLNPVSHFLNKANVNQIIQENLLDMGINMNIGILSIDLDGVDYWILKEITCINPTIIICEYNSLFGDDMQLTVPYDENFVRSKYHYSNLYWGASLKSFKVLLSKKGYIYIGSNSQNTNAFFVKEGIAKKHLKQLLEPGPKFEFSKIRESRSKNGKLNFLRHKDRLKIIREMDLFNLESNKMIKVGSLID